MIDLSLQHKELYPLKWFDGTMIHLLPPTQKQFNMILNMKSYISEEDLSIINDIEQLVVDIINNNREQRELDGSQLTIEICLAIIEDYFMFYSKQMEKNINFHQSHQ